MAHNDIRTRTYATARPGNADHIDVGPPAALIARLSARLFAGRFDCEVEDGVVARAGSALAVHTARLRSAGERAQLAQTLRGMLADTSAAFPISLRVALHVANIASSQDLIEDVMSQLCAPRPVRARGMARLRILLADGAGPLYRCGRGSLSAELRGVLAAF